MKYLLILLVACSPSPKYDYSVLTSKGTYICDTNPSPNMLQDCENLMNGDKIERIQVNSDSVILRFEENI